MSWRRILAWEVEREVRLRRGAILKLIDADALSDEVELNPRDKAIFEIIQTFKVYKWIPYPDGQESLEVIPIDYEEYMSILLILPQHWTRYFSFLGWQ